jgi:ATP synthase protein I
LWAPVILDTYGGRTYGPPAFDAPRRPVSGGFSDIWETVLTAPDPDRLNDLGKRLDEFQTKQEQKDKRPEPSQSGIATRIVAELVGGLAVGCGLGWGFDHVFHTAPWGLVVFFMLGAAAGFRGVMRIAQGADAASDIEEK